MVWDQKLSPGLMLLTFMTVHLSQFRFAVTERYWHPSWLITLTFFGTDDIHVRVWRGFACLGIRYSQEVSRWSDEDLGSEVDSRFDVAHVYGRTPLPISTLQLLSILVKPQMKALYFKWYCYLVKRGPDILQRTFSFTDAHAVAFSISSLVMVRSCRLQG